MRFLSKRRVLILLGATILVVLALIGGAAAYLHSQAFNEQARRYIIREIERRTGATAVLNAFEWSFWTQRFRLDELTLRGLEPAGEAPLAHFPRIDVGLNFRTLFQRQIDLFELTLTQPGFHILVSPDGRTNFPKPPQTGQRPLNVRLSIQNFKIAGGSALLNEQKIRIDFAIQNLEALLDYQGAREVLAAHLRYDGLLDRSPQSKPSIPYTLDGDMDYTRATLVVQRMTLRSGATEVKLQGRINDFLSSKISGKLDYTGAAQVPFLNYFFTRENFAGKAGLAGFLEFSRDHFFTQGTAVSDAVDFEGWRAASLRGEYTYHFPDRRLSFRNMTSQIAGGAVSGNVAVENVPGPSRVLLDLNYSGVDAAAVARAYPWDKKYRIFSRTTGTLHGWFEGKLDRYDFSGHAGFKSYTPPGTDGLVPLPIDGSTDYELRPKQATAANAEVRLYSTSIKAAGLIHGTMSDLRISMSSADLKDVAFLYPDANGSGVFTGTLTGRIAKPLLNGEFTLQNHLFRNWTIQQASGGVRLDVLNETADLRNVRVTQGESQILVNGSAALSGSPVNLRVHADRVTANDLRAFVDQNVDGTFAGDIRIASLSPTLRLEGDVRADNLSVDGRLVGNGRGHVRYAKPSVEITQLSVRQGQSTLTGDAAFNRATDAVMFTARISAVDLDMFRALGLPESVRGLIRQADLRGEGTRSRPNISGSATLQNLSFYDEVFPQARVQLTSAGSRLDVRMDAASNLGLTAQIDTASKGYAFTARAAFTQYPIERIAKIRQGTIRATGAANFSGILADRNRLSGEGRIEAAEARVQNTVLRTTKPFTFSFTSEQVKLTGVALAGDSTEVTLGGTVGLVERAPLNLGVSGKLNLALISAAYPEWISSGTVNVEGNIGGTAQTPDLRGFASLTNASLRREGFFTSLSNLNGIVAFDQNNITLNNVAGRVGGGDVRAQGSATLQRGTIQAMNIRIEASGIRVRYPEGLRTVLNGTLALRGSWESPRLEGNLQVQNLAYRSSFEDFLALLSERNGASEPAALNRLKLSVHVEGSRNITIQNQLADVEARIDVDIKGSTADPSVTGHIEASGGTLFFQGNRYRITRGNIDFVDPLRIEPIVDVQAESEVRDYRVILSFSGAGERLKLNMRSDPPLPELEIVNLIAGGRTKEEVYRPGDPASVRTSEQLFQSGAASILFDLLQQRVGNRLGLLGLDRVRIDPFLVGASNNPGARITLSEQVTKDLTVTYSQDLSSNRQQVILIEYFFNRNTSILASRDELGNFGLDIRLRKRLK